MSLNEEKLINVSCIVALILLEHISLTSGRYTLFCIYVTTLYWPALILVFRCVFESLLVKTRIYPTFQENQ